MANQKDKQIMASSEKTMTSRRTPQSTSDAHDNRRTSDNEHHENNRPPRFSNITTNEG